MLRDGQEYRNDERQAVGRSLKQAREEQGLSLEQVEQVSMIHAHHLEALERGDYEALPNPLWARGSLILYAGHLGMDGEQVADRLFPLRRASALERYVRGHWRLIVTALSVVALVAVLSAATIIAPYNPVTQAVSDALQRVAPSLFLGSEPQRVAVLGVADSASGGGGSVLLVEVAEDGLEVLSIPRDASATIPGHGQGQIGEALGIGGPGLMRQTVAGFADTEVQYYCLIDPEGIREIVGSTDGVEINVPAPVSGQSVPNGPTITLRPGPQTLDGDQAVVYLQGKDLPNDAARAKRQQSFLYAMFRQALGPSNLLANPTALSTGSKNIETNMSSVQMVQLAGRLRELKGSDAPTQTETITGSQEEAESAP